MSVGLMFQGGEIRTLVYASGFYRVEGQVRKVRFDRLEKDYRLND